MLKLLRKGLYCQAGDFYIDPQGAVDHAVITHAHSDHARRGSKKYYTVHSGVSLLKTRLGKNISVADFKYGEKFFIRDVQISFHPAGHILGSSQVRLEWRGKVWVASGDYKREPDPTCPPFEVVPCDVFLTEATFGTPAFSWNQNTNLGEQIFEWWSENVAKGVNSVLFAYSLGKAQRVLGVIQPYAKKPIYCHPATSAINECYRSQGVNLAPTICLSTVPADQQLRGELFLVPSSFFRTEQSKILGDHFETAFASGWMSKKNTGYGRESRYDKGFVMSDHADWNDLLKTISETRAKRVYVQHRGKGALIKHLRSLGLEAFPDTDLIPKNPDQLVLF